MGTLGKAASTHGMCEAKATRADVTASGSVLDAKACEVQDKAVMGGFAREQLDRAASICVPLEGECVSSSKTREGCSEEKRAGGRTEMIYE